MFYSFLTMEKKNMPSPPKSPSQTQGFVLEKLLEGK